MRLFLLTLLLIVGLSACTNPPRFDNEEYRIVVDLRVLMEDPDKICETPETAKDTALQLKDLTHYLRVYNEYNSENVTFYEMTAEIDDMATEMVAAYNDEENYPPSLVYCSHKTRTILKNIITLQQISRNKYYD